MTIEQKKKLNQLKEKIQKKIKEKYIEDNILLQECLSLLADYTIISDEKETEKILSIANSNALKALNSLHKTEMIDSSHFYYVVWNDADTPIIECSGADIIRCWDDIMAVAFNTCFIDKQQKTAVLFKG